MRTPRYVWGAPTRPATLAQFDEFGAEGLTDRRGLTQLRFALESVGVPTVAGALTPKEDVIGLLMLAAEVEHALMVQYLYAAQSLRGADARVVAHVAIQEMGHLLTVQNLILALTGVSPEGLPSAIHFGRDGLRRNSPRNPLPLTLERVTHAALAKFVVVESPHTISDKILRARVDALAQEAANSGVQANPVYALYAAIRWIFQGDDVPDESQLSADAGLRSGWHVPDADFAPVEVIEQFAADQVEWHSVPGFIALPARDRREALAAIDAITMQGEGLPGGANSHFASFLNLLDRFESGQVRVKDLPRTPWVPEQAPSEDAAATVVMNPYTALWSQMFNVQYELLIVAIAWAYSHSRADAKRQALVDLTIDSMNLVIQPLSADAIARPVSTVSPQLAGPTYGLLDETVPRSRTDYIARFSRLADRVQAVAAAIRSSPEFPDDSIGALRLEAIGALDARLNPLLP